MKSEFIYLDHAAATPLDERVLAAMQPYFAERFFNPSSPYLPAVEVRRDYEAAKATIAHVIGAKPDELVMTAGATESINLAFSGEGHVVVAAIEHHAVLAAARRRPHTIVASDERGQVSSEVIMQAITPETTLVSVALANNELGTIQPIVAIAEVVAAERRRRQEVGEATPLYLHSDASQGLGQLDISVARFGIDMLTLNAAKIYGPKQVGLLWVSTQVELTPQIVGGGQERGLRSGTENVAGVIGFAKAIELADQHRTGEVRRLEALRDRLQRQLVDAFPGAVFSGHQRKRLASHLHVSFPGIDGERLVFLLEAKHVLVATGSACAANKGTRSHVLVAIGMPEDVIDGSLRLSLGRLTDEASIDTAAEEIITAVKSEQERTA